MTKEMEMWNKVTTDNDCLNELLPMKRTRKLRVRGHDYVLPPVRSEKFKRCFINRCLFNFISISNFHLTFQYVLLNHTYACGRYFQ